MRAGRSLPQRGWGLVVERRGFHPVASQSGTNGVRTNGSYPNRGNLRADCFPEPFRGKTVARALRYRNRCCCPALAGTQSSDFLRSAQLSSSGVHTTRPGYRPEGRRATSRPAPNPAARSNRIAPLWLYRTAAAQARTANRRASAGRPRRRRKRRVINSPHRRHADEAAERGRDFRMR